MVGWRLLLKAFPNASEESASVIGTASVVLEFTNGADGTTKDIVVVELEK
jgi:hypothetical protein